jgi:hypothetical protein
MVDCYDYDQMLFPLSPISDSLWSTASSCSSNDEYDAEQEQGSFISTIDEHYIDNNIDFNSYDHLEAITRPFKKQYKEEEKGPAMAVAVAVPAIVLKSTAEMATQTDPILPTKEEEEEQDDGDGGASEEHKETIIITGDVVSKIEKLSAYYGSYGADCICFSGLYKAGILISRKIQMSDYQEYIRGKAKASEFLCRIYQKHFRGRSDASLFDLHIKHLRSFCNDIGQSQSRRRCLEFINSFISLHLDNGTPSG